MTKDDLRVNGLVQLFEDHQEETKPIGLGLILEVLEEELPFILENDPSEVVYAPIKLKCVILKPASDGYYPLGYEKIFKKRIVKSGIVSNEEEKEEILPIDKFLEVDGEEIY